MMTEPNTPEALNITVLMGGPSDERKVSLLSGAAIADALETRGHVVTRADITPTDTRALDRDDIDVVVIALHGPFGESGEVQRLCEQRGLRYTGSGPRASQLGMDKAAAKQLFKRAGLTTPDWMIIENFHDPKMVRQWLEEIPPPCVVKPVCGGSSLHISICRDEPSRDAAIEELLDLEDRAMLERFVPGREITVGILGEQTLPVIEILPGHAFYDFESKYADDAGTEYRFDLGLDQAGLDRIAADARTAHQCLDCRDLSRVDFVLDSNLTPHVLEINTIPGFTGHSLVPMAAAEVGLAMPALCQKLVDLAMARTLCLS
jgi:D-alanine-D-alanine ligase